MCGDYIPDRRFVQDKSEYPEGVPDDLMALPLCRVCLRENTGGIVGPFENAFAMICPCFDPGQDPAGHLTRKLRECYALFSIHGSTGESLAVTNTMEQAGPRLVSAAGPF